MIRRILFSLLFLAASVFVIISIYNNKNKVMTPGLPVTPSTPPPTPIPAPTPLVSLGDTPANFISFAPSGQWLAVAQGMKISILDTENFQARASFSIPHEVDYMAVSSDDRYLAIGDQSVLQLRDTSTWEVVFEDPEYVNYAHTSSASPFGFSPNGRLLAYTIDKNEVIHTVLLDISASEVIQRINGYVFSKFDNRGRFIATSSHEWRYGKSRELRESYGRYRTNRFLIWDTETSKQHLLFQLDESRNPNPDFASAKFIDFSADGRFITTNDAFRAFVIWDASTGQEIRQVNLQFYPGALIFSPVENILAYYENEYQNRPLVLWNSESGEILFELPDCSIQSSIVQTQVQFSKDGRLVAAMNFTGQACVWEVHSGKLLTLLEGARGIVWYIGQFSFSPDGKYLVTRGQLWDIESGALVLGPVRTEPSTLIESEPANAPEVGKPVVTAGGSNVNIRRYPNEYCDKVDSLPAGQSIEIVGRNADTSWWQVSIPNGLGWVADWVTTASNIDDGVPVVSTCPNVLGTHQERDEHEKWMFNKINEFRKDNEKQPLDWNEELNRSADWFSGSPYTGCHADSLNNGIDSRVNCFGFPKWATEVLNISSNDSNEGRQKAFHFWMESENHKKELLDDEVEVMGIGHTQSPPNAHDKWWVWVVTLAQAP